MKVCVLGSLTLEPSHDDSALRRTTVTATKPARLLALLALNGGRPVPTTEIVEELWDGREPTSVTTTLQAYVVRLRRLIAEVEGCTDREAKSILATSPAGYLLDVHEGGTDCATFGALSERGRRCEVAGDLFTASNYLRTALSLWRGDALSGLSTGPLLQPLVMRLNEARRCVLDLSIEVDLELGRHRDVLAELTELTARHVTDERSHAQLMLALHRSGRRAQALEVYRQLRRAMVARLGIEPSPELRDLQRAILSADPSLDHGRPIATMAAVSGL